MEHDSFAISGFLSAALIGLVIGVRHATDADHVVAVSTMVRDYRNVFKGLWIGVSWGLGHSTPLMILGLFVLFIKESLLGIYEDVAPYLEFAVALMLVGLGVHAFWKLRQGAFHVHEHLHDDDQHAHMHGSHQHLLGVTANPHQNRRHFLFPELLPFFRMKSYVIGLIHGLAGSAAILLVLVLSTSDAVTGVIFLSIFALGTMVSMAAMTIVLSLPFALFSRTEKHGNIIVSIAAGLSIILGFALGSDIILGTTFTGILWY